MSGRYVSEIKHCGNCEGISVVIETLRNCSPCSGTGYVVTEAVPEGLKRLC